MTDTEKRKVEKLRAEGYSYNMISKTLGISLSTIKSHIRRKAKKSNTHQLTVTTSSFANAAVRRLSTRLDTGRRFSAEKAARSVIGMNIVIFHCVNPLSPASAPVVEKRFSTTKGNTANTAHTNATLLFGMEDVVMSKNEVSYLVTMLLFRKMMDDSLLSQDDYKAINVQMKQKYDPKIGDLFTSFQLSRTE